MDVGGAALGVEEGSTGAAAAGVVVEGVEDCLGSSLTRAFAAFLTLSFIAIFVLVYKGDGVCERNINVCRRKERNVVVGGEYVDGLNEI